VIWKSGTGKPGNPGQQGLIDLLSTKENDKSPDTIDARGWRFVIGMEKVNKVNKQIRMSPIR